MSMDKEELVLLAGDRCDLQGFFCDWGFPRAWSDAVQLARFPTECSKLSVRSDS